MAKVTYAITLKSAEELAELNDGEVEHYANVGSQTFNGFTVVDGGMFDGDFQGLVDGEEVIFLKDEIAKVTLENC